MSIVKVNEFVKTYNSGKKGVDCVHTDCVYTDSGFTSGEFLDVVQRNECSISVKCAKPGGNIITGVPIIYRDTIELEKRKGKFKWINLGAIPISIHKLGYYDTESTTGTVFIVDGRKRGGKCVVKAYDFDITKKPAHFIFAPNANFDLHDELLIRACEIYVSFNDNIYAEGACPFGLEIGAIFRLSNALNCLHRAGEIENGEFGGSHQAIFNTIGWDTKKHEDAHGMYNQEIFKSGLFLAEPIGVPKIVEGKRRNKLPFCKKQRGPSKYLDYVVKGNQLEEAGSSCGPVRSGQESFDEFRVSCKLLDNTSRTSFSNGFGRTAGTESSTNCERLGVFERGLHGPAKHKSTEIQKEDATEKSFCSSSEGTDAWNAN
uniref:MP n=1 Tax=Gymnadenia betaflexivirus 1 TaxID=2794403 RepID=A0A7T5QZ72_9VIRU|nr:MP [Gymnadenia betaflexivirus 1]